MRILVIGGTGKVGRHLVPGLRAAGVEAIVAARNPGPGGIAVDQRDARALAEAARGFDAAYLTTPLGADETEVGLAALDALGRAGVGKIVYLAIHNLEAMAEVPHFATKIPIKQAVLARGGTVLQPNFFFQNDAMFLDAMRFGGVYPMPVGSVGVWSIDAADIAAAAANALTRDDWNRQAVPLCGPERLTGETYAANWSAVLGRPVAYGGDDLGPFMAGIERAIPGMDDWTRRDFETMMRVTQARGCPATEADLAASRAAVGRDLKRHEDFAHELLAAHEQQASPGHAQAMA